MMNKRVILMAGVLLGLVGCGTQSAPVATAGGAGVVHRLATCDSTNVALNKPATASSSENAGSLGPANAVDGSPVTRWASSFTGADPDNQSLQVDLGSTQTICGGSVSWEAAYAASYSVQVAGSPSGPWTTIFSLTDASGNRIGTPDVITPTQAVPGRYVRVQGVKRGTGYGYSIRELVLNTGAATTPPPPGNSCTTNAALNRPATASSSEFGDVEAQARLAFDGNPATRWSSAFSDAQWLQVDLGSAQTVCGLKLEWEAAYGKAFRIEVSNDQQTWTKLYDTANGTGGSQTITPTAAASGRYVRLTGTQRAGGYGYSLYEMQVFTSGGTGGGTPLPTSDTPNFGPNVKIYEASTPASTIQADLDTAFNAQLRNAAAQFGDQRNVFLFKPGSYGRVFANVGFYTTVAGLGKNPDDVVINGAVNVDSGWVAGDEKNATQNFWRSAENLAVVPEGGTNRWAVSQAAPMRRVHIRGNLTLAPSNQDSGQGYSSGGYLADSRVDGQVTSGSQQQWYTRDSSLSGWSGSVWNMVFSGVQGAPAQNFPNPSHTVLATTPISREKPYLYFENGKYAVFVPNVRVNASGASWPNTPGTSVPLSQFYVARPGDSAATLNQALSQGLNLLLTPGVYHLSQTLNVTRANTVVYGLGFPTLIPDGGVDAMKVADVDGVKLSGLLFDAGTVNSAALLTVGAAGQHVGHASNPASVQDVYFRIGGSVAGKATTSLVINSDDVLVDHIWAWRADHGNAGTYGWTVNTADTGLTVNGNNVTATGLFVEHYQKYEVLWNGERGRTIFFQNEIPYDPPSQAAWRSGASGYPAYKVADSVTSHEAWGLGSYIYTNVAPSIHLSSAFEVPNTAGVKFRDLVTVSLNNQGTIDHIINTAGGAVPIAGTNTAPSYLVQYP